MNLRPTARWLFLVALIGLGVLVIVSLTSNHLRIYRQLLQAPSEATGIVTSDTQPNADVVFYRFQASGKSWLGSFRPDRVLKDYHEGSQLPVYYLASDPGVNFAAKPTPDYLKRELARCYGLGLLVLVIVVLCAHRWLTKSRPEPFMLDTDEFPGAGMY